MSEYEYLTISEAFDLLSKLELTTQTEKQGLEYAEKFHTVKAAGVKKAKKELSQVGGLTEKTITKIIDLMPKSRELLMVVLNSSSLNLPEEKVTKIIDIIRDLAE